MHNWTGRDRVGMSEPRVKSNEHIPYPKAKGAKGEKMARGEGKEG